MPTSRICCLDASIVVRLLTDPFDHPVVSLWQEWQEEDVTIIAPHLLHYEVTNALYQQQRQNVFSREAVGLMITTASLLPIQLYTYTDLHSEAHRLAMEWGLPATYDAYYLAAAEHHGATFWTADKKLVNLINGKLDWVHYVPRKDE